MDIEIRKIEAKDNIELAAVIRSVLKEHGVDKPGTVFTDPTTDALFSLFQQPKSIYFVALQSNKIVGGCGIFPTIGLPDNCTELVKLYVTKDARGKGVGYELMQRSIQFASELNYKQVYLETLPELSKAVSLYKRLGFEDLDKPLGNSGHFACDIWMLKKIP